MGVASDADVVVLGLLAECPRHGYDLDRVIDQRGYREWTSLAFSSIYYVLKRLADRGLIEPVAQSEGRKTVFQLNDAGERELREAAAERISRHDPPTAAALPALGAYRRLDDPALLAALHERINALTSRIAWLQQARAVTTVEHAQVIFDYELSRHEADLTWTQNLCNRLAATTDAKEKK